MKADTVNWLPLIDIHDLWYPMLGDRLLQCFDGGVRGKTDLRDIVAY